MHPLPIMSNVCIYTKNCISNYGISHNHLHYHFHHSVRIYQQNSYASPSPIWNNKKKKKKGEGGRVFWLTVYQR